MSATEALWQFAIVAALLTITPGMDSALVLHAAIRHGRRAAAAAGAGICLGALVWGVAAALGLSALFAVSATAFLVLKVVGAAYLVYLGVRMLWSALRAAPVSVDAVGMPVPSIRAAAAKGVLTTLLNPKVAVFYIAVLPAFLPPDAPAALFGAALAGIHAALSAVWFAVLVLGAQALRRWMSRPSTQRGIDVVTGTAFIGFGAALAFTEK
ncbi:LysE family translocator [Microcella flavibacter]|uniref:LysE family translocator n=1 Tax=Microcella flavibacter TaxID=1804990 RepID=UPI001E3C7D47|nr:LysE family translocator [Microcella flavibacter]